MKRILHTALALTLLLSVGGMALGQTKRANFGALEGLSAEAAKAKLTAWLKEVGKSDEATTQKLTAIWQDNQRTILDRVADSLGLGDPLAAKLIQEARNPAAPAPVVLPVVFKNEKTSAFYRANLGLVYARSLVNRRV